MPNSLLVHVELCFIFNGVYKGCASQIPLNVSINEEIRKGKVSNFRLMLMKFFGIKIIFVYPIRLS